MPDAPISYTPTIALAQWDDGADPGFEALNLNWQIVDDAVLSLQETIDTLSDAIDAETAARIAADASNSAADQGYALALVTTEAATRAADDVTEAGLRAAADSAESAARIAADLDFLLLDGSRPMEGDLDLDSNKIVSLGNGTANDHAINKGQLDAAIAAGLGSLGVYTYCRASASLDLASGTSPRTFEADTNDEITHPEIHDEDTNPERFYAPSDGYYEFEARFKVQGFAGCGVEWFKNGVAMPEGKWPQFLPAVGSNITFIVTAMKARLVAGDYVVAKVYGLAEPDEGVILADSTLSVFCLSANGVGGGDLKSDGSVPMTADFDNAGNKQINMADGVADTDGATVGQTADLVDAAIVAADLPGQVAAAVASELAAARLLQVAEAVGIALFDTTFPDSTFQDVTGATVTFTLDYAQRVEILADGFAIDDGSNSCLGQFRLHVTDFTAAVTTKDGPVVSGGNDVNYCPLGMKWITGVLPAGSTTIKLQFRNQSGNSNARVQVTNFQVGYFN